MVISDSVQSTEWGDAFTEGNSWHYTWSVFHDVQGLIDLMGGKEIFVSMLDSVFSVPPIFDDSYYRGVIHEIREMEIMNMGNYAHGNQPIQHMIYLYNYAGEPWKAQYWLREVMIVCIFLLLTVIVEIGGSTNGSSFDLVRLYRIRILSGMSR